MNYDNSIEPLLPLHWSSRCEDAVGIMTASRKIFRTFGIGVPISVDSEISVFVSKFNDTITKMRSHNDAIAFYEACKVRYNLLYKKLDEILDNLNPTSVIVLGRPNQKKVYKLGSDTHIFIVNEYSDKDVIIDIKLIDNVNPRAYKHLYRAVAEIIMEFYLHDDINTHDDKIKIVKECFMCILTIAKIYENLRGDKIINLQEENDAICRLNMPDIDVSMELTQLFESVQNDIKLGFKAPLYIRDLSFALKKVSQAPMNYMDEDYHISCRSTGTRYLNRSVNGILSSILEVDHLIGCNFDKLTGYKSNYRISPDPKCDQADRKTISIEQNKLNRRVIHMASNPIQDRANFYHRRLEKLLRLIPTDCTFNQEKGITYALMQTQASRLNITKNNIYSLDLSKATDTLSKLYQQQCLALLFGQQLAEEWTSIVSGKHKFYKSDTSVEEIEPKRGQPQGYKSSFPAFALAHHLVMRMVMKSSGLENMNPEEFYRVLGDDSIITCNDPELKIRDNYIHICRMVGWECNPSKGYSFRYDIDKSASAEFAKVRTRNGESFTPLPLATFLSLKSDRLEDNLAPILWYSRRVKNLTIHEVCNRLNSNGIILRTEVYNMMYYLTEFQLGEFQNLQRNNVDFEDSVKLNVLLSYFSSKLKSTLLEEWIPTHLGGSGKSARIKSDPFLGYDQEIEFLDSITNYDHKYWTIIQANERLINILNNLFGKSSINLSVCRLQMEPEDQDLIFQACEFLIQGIGSDLNPQSFITIVDAAIGVLNKYNPRKHSDSLIRETHYLTQMAKIYRTIEVKRALNF